MTIELVERSKNAQGRRTHAALLDAALAIIGEHGFTALTMTAVAERAGLSRRSAYLHFTGRNQMVIALYERLTGDGRLEVHTRPLREAEDTDQVVRAWAHHVAGWMPDYANLIAAVDLAADTDPDAAAFRDRTATAQLASCRSVAARIADDGRLAPGWDPEAAADLLYAWMSPGWLRRLVGERGWSRERCAHAIEQAVRRTLVRER